ncbi:Holliday junction ATP-dependent DNA helicase RuvA [Bienertia sinuspersici]
MAATAPERSRTLHNFSLPPRLNWGSQRLLRCSKLNNNNNSSNFTSPSNDDVSYPDRKRRNASFRSPPLPSIHHEDNQQIEVMRQRLILDLRSEVEQIRATFLGNSDIAPPPPPESRPWNLRTRRSPATAEIPPPTTAADGCSSGGRAKFSVSLSKQEIEDDFVQLTGKRPPRKPKKRPRYVQKHLDNLFPGSWLSEITADMYKVNQIPEAPK